MPPLDLPLLARDIAAAALLLLSLALPWWTQAYVWAGQTHWGDSASGQSVPATIFTVLAVFACAVTYVLPMLFSTRLSSMALLGVKGVIVAPLVIMGIIAVVQTLRGEQPAGPAVAVALTGAVLTLQTTDRERSAVALWRNTALGLAGVTALVSIIWFILNVRSLSGFGGAVVLPIVTLAMSLVVVGAVAVAVVRSRPFAAGIALVGAASVVVLIIRGFLGGAGGIYDSAPDLCLQFMLVAAAAAPALHRRIPALTGRDGWVPATSSFVLVAAVLWGFGFLLHVISVLVLSVGTGSPDQLGLVIWLLALQVIAALAFAITYRMVTTSLAQGRMVALVAAAVLGVASVVTWAAAGTNVVFTSAVPSILVFSLALVGLVTIPPVMRATPIQPLSVPGAQAGPPPAGYPGQPYPGQAYPGQPGPYPPGPGQPFPPPGPPVGPYQGPPQGPPGAPTSGPMPAHPASGPVHPASGPVHSASGPVHLGPGPVPPHPNPGPRQPGPGQVPQYPNSGPQQQAPGHPEGGPGPQGPNPRKAPPPDEDDEW